MNRQRNMCYELKARENYKAMTKLRHSMPFCHDVMINFRKSVSKHERLRLFAIISHLDGVMSS
jgi:hypothetical protein